MLPDRSIPRPTFAPVFADIAAGDVREWLEQPRKDFDGKDFAASTRDILLALATETKLDAFAYGEALKSKLDWPVDAALVYILTTNIRYTKEKALRRLTMDWVMKTGWRWTHPVGSTFAIMDRRARYNREAKVLSIDRVTASATMEYVNGEKQTVHVNIEDVRP